MNRNSTNLMLLDKIGLYILSLWLLFCLLVFLTVKVNIDFSSCNSISSVLFQVIYHNILPVVSIFFLIIGTFYFLFFDHHLKGVKPIQVQVKEIKDINFEHITFLTTYIIPFLGFNTNNTRYVILIILLLIIIGIIYIKTDLFYANPTLSLLGYRIYRITGENNSASDYTGVIIITKCNISVSNEVKLLKLSEKVYYGKTV